MITALPKDVLRLLVLDYFDPLTKVRCMEIKLFWNLFLPKPWTVLRELQKKCIMHRNQTLQQRYYDVILKHQSERTGKIWKRCRNCNGMVEEKEKCNCDFLIYFAPKHCSHCDAQFISFGSPHPENEGGCQLRPDTCPNSRDLHNYESCKYTGYAAQVKVHISRHCTLKCKYCSKYVLSGKVANHSVRPTYELDNWICRRMEFKCWWQCGKYFAVQQLVPHEESCCNTLIPCITCGVQLPRASLISKLSGLMHRCDKCTYVKPPAPPIRPRKDDEPKSDWIVTIARQGLRRYSKS